MRFQVEHGTRWRHEEITANQDPLQNATRRAFEFYIGIDRATGAGITSGQYLLVCSGSVDFSDKIIRADFIVEVFSCQRFFTNCDLAGFGRDAEPARESFDHCVLDLFKIRQIIA